MRVDTDSVSVLESKTSLRRVRRQRIRLSGPIRTNCFGSAGVAQLVEHNLAKVGVAGSNPVARSITIKQEVRSQKQKVNKRTKEKLFLSLCTSCLSFLAFFIKWRRTQVARGRSAKPLFSGSNPLVASTFPF
ncbi:MAG: hypothetical protein FD164_161 [Nitrospirae bacterium]|nr:MAG: hypothetical protein FD164_161 [Nitrospirota bacterium]